MTPAKISRGPLVAVWSLRVLVALVFLATGVMKLTGQPMAIEEFQHIGLGQWFRLVTGAIEVIGALVLLWPSTSAIGALLLFCVSLGALVAQATILHGDVIHTLVLMALTAWLVWLGRNRLPIGAASPMGRG